MDIRGAFVLQEAACLRAAAGNYRMSEFVGAILLAQISRLEEQTDARYANVRCPVAEEVYEEAREPPQDARP